MTASLASNDDVKAAIAESLFDDIVASTEGIIPTSRDPEGDRPRIIAERDAAIRGVVESTIESEAFVEIFNESLGNVQPRIAEVSALDREDVLRNRDAVVVDFRKLYLPIYEGLAAEPSVAVLTEHQPTETSGLIVVADRDTAVGAAWRIIANADLLRYMMIVAAIALGVGAVYISERRPTTIVQIGGSVIALAALVLVTVLLIRALIPLLVDDSANAKVYGATYAALTNTLLSTLVRLAAAGVGVYVLGVIARLLWPDNWVQSDLAPQSPLYGARATTYPGQQSANQPFSYASAANIPVHTAPPSAPARAAASAVRQAGAAGSSGSSSTSPRYQSRPTIPVPAVQIPSEVSQKRADTADNKIQDAPEQDLSVGRAAGIVAKVTLSSSDEHEQNASRSPGQAQSATRLAPARVEHPMPGESVRVDPEAGSIVSKFESQTGQPTASAGPGSDVDDVWATDAGW